MSSNSQKARELIEYIKRRKIVRNLNKAEIIVIRNLADGLSFSCKNNEESEIEEPKSRCALPEVSAELVKFLCSDKTVADLSSPRGVHIRDAVICRSSERTEIERNRDDLALDLDAVNLDFGLYFNNCKFPGGIQLRDATCSLVGFVDCEISEIRLDRAQVGGGFWLKDNVIFSPFSAIGAKFLSSVSITGNRFLDFRKKSVSNIDDILYYGNLDCSISLSGSSIEGVFTIKNNICDCYIDLSHLCVRHSISDDRLSYKQPPNLLGCEYGALADVIDPEWRKSFWIRRSIERFHPQPYQQLAKFYRATGYRREAQEILVRKEVEQRKVSRVLRTGKCSFLTKLFNFINFVWDLSSRWIAGYGYKPWRSLWWIGGLVLIMMFAAKFTWNAGDFAPNSAIILTSPEWKALADVPAAYASLSEGEKQKIVRDMTPAHFWSAPNAPGKDYETFYSFAYALDVVVPVLDLGQTDAWAPSPARGGWGYWMFYAQKMFVVAGWVVTAIAAAAISGMIRRDD